MQKERGSAVGFDLYHYLVKFVQQNCLAGIEIHNLLYQCSL